MGKNLGGSAGFLALMAVALHLSLPGSRETTPAPNDAPGAGKTTERSSVVAPEDGRPDGPWLATRPFFRSLESTATPQLSGKDLDFRDAGEIVKCAGDERSKGEDEYGCQAGLRRFFGLKDWSDEHWRKKDRSEVEFAIATVPDPYHTRLSLATDGMLQTIEQAATDAGWEFATQWLPWNDTVNPEEKDPAKRREARRLVGVQEKQPGVMVFRRSPSGDGFSPRTLMVWVVGERPTAGMNPAQFQIARAYTRAMGDPELVKIVGPTFSGSLDSLSHLLTDDPETGRSYRIRSGTVTSRGARLAFPNKFDFRSESLDSGELEEKFKEALTRLGIEQRDALVLLEDESNYANSMIHYVPSGTHVIKFPRDISHLRNAFPEVKPVAEAKPAELPDLSLSLKDNTAGEDSLPIYSTTQTPIEQDAFLNQVTQTIRRERIRLVQVSATNVLDSLFLARVLRQQCPDARLLVMPSADLMFAQAARTANLNGLLAISPYWMSPYPETPSRDLNIYTDGDAARLFSAARQLFSDDAATTLPNPEAWLLVLDRQGFLPISVSEPKAAVQTVFPRRRPSSAWILIATVLLLLSGGIVLWTVLLARNPDWVVDARLELRLHSKRDAWRLFYVFSFLLLAGWLQVILWLPFIDPAWWRGADAAGFAVIGSSLALIPLLVSAWLLKAQPAAGISLAPALPAASGVVSGLKKLSKPTDGTRPVWVRVLMGLAVAAAAASLWIWCTCCFNSDSSMGVSFRYRAAELRPGSSPVWPVLLSGAALLLYCFVHQTRVYLAVCQAPRLVVNELTSAFKPRMRRAYLALNGSLSGLLGLWDRKQRIWLAASLAVLLALSAVWRADLKLSSVNPRLFDLLAGAMQMGVFAALLLTTWHVTVVWRHLRTLLAALSDLPLARAFVRADRSGGNRPLWVRRLNLQSLDGHTQSAVILHDLGLTAVDGGSKPLRELKEFGSKYVEQLCALLDPNVGRRPKTRSEMWRQHEELRCCNRRVTRYLLINVLRPHWHGAKLVRRMNESPSPAGMREERNPYALWNDPACAVNLAETFVALHCSAYLTYGVRQIQNLILFLSFGYALLTLSLNSYAPQAPQAIGKVLIALFVIIAVVLWKCMAGIERNPILSRIAGTNPGELNKEFYFKMAGYVALPLAGVLASEFPSISNTLFSWLQPALESLK